MGPEGEFFLGHNGAVGYVVTPGEHTVTETEVDGYDLDSVACFTEYGTENQAPFDSEDTNGADGVTVDLSADDDVTCVFTNIPETTPSNSVSIVKTNNANGQGDYTKKDRKSVV